MFFSKIHVSESAHALRKTETSFLDRCRFLTMRHFVVKITTKLLSLHFGKPIHVILKLVSFDTRNEICDLTRFAGGD
jgi:hypothetical protein